MSVGKRGGDLWPKASWGGGRNPFLLSVTEARAEQRGTHSRYYPQILPELTVEHEAIGQSSTQCASIMDLHESLRMNTLYVCFLKVELYC